MTTDVQPAAKMHERMAGAALPVLGVWKQQFDIAMQLVEAMTEGAAKIHEWQLQAAVDANANATATQRAAAKAGDPQALLGAETLWMQDNMEQAASYWRMLFEMGLETHANLLKCLLQSQPGALVDLDAAKDAALEMVESTYCQWLEASRRLGAVAGIKGDPAGA